MAQQCRDTVIVCERKLIEECVYLDSSSLENNDHGKAAYRPRDVWGLVLKSAKHSQQIKGSDSFS